MDTAKSIVIHRSAAGLVGGAEQHIRGEGPAPTKRSPSNRRSAMESAPIHPIPCIPADSARSRDRSYARMADFVFFTVGGEVCGT